MRLLAYSSISQGGFILMPLAMAGTGDSAGPALRAVVVYLSSTQPRTSVRSRSSSRSLARRAAARSARFGGLFSYAPGLTVMMTIFLASLAGIPPLGGWYAKFGAFRAVVDAGGGWGYSIAVIGAINAVIATAYYIMLMREMWMKPVPDGDVTPIR